MKNILPLLLFAMFLFAGSVQGQQAKELPAATIIVPFKLQVGYNYSTVLKFPAALLPGDRGTEDIMAQIESGVDNILKLKAAVRNFTATNLHVYTQDNKVYVFEISYTDKPDCTTFDLTRMEIFGAAAPVAPAPPINDYQLANFAAHIKTFPPFLQRTVSKHGIRCRLEGIYSLGGLLLFNFQVSNRSALDYGIDFCRFYVKDKKKLKNVSYQQHEIITRYKDAISTIAGPQTIAYTIAIPQVTIPDGKVFYLEIFEKNGGRHLVMRIKNRHLLKARKLQ